MNNFKNIDEQLAELALKLDGKLSLDRPSYPKQLRTFEERRIDWVENDINKAIVIHPKFESSGVNSNLWTFKILAWNVGQNGIRKNTWSNTLIKEQTFETIEKKIDDFLKESLLKLKTIKLSNLIPFQGIYLILDLDGVLITTPNWKSDEFEKDGYSKFNSNCIEMFNELLVSNKFQIWLSSTRRKGKSLQEFNKIFYNRGVKSRIMGFLPVYEDCKDRKEEILRFIKEMEITKFLILDDDNSLNSLDIIHKRKLVKTSNLIGFNKNDLDYALEIIRNEI